MNFSEFFSQNSESIINFRKSHEISSKNVKLEQKLLQLL